MKPFLICLAVLIAASSTSFAQYNWSTWAYPTSTTATASVGGGTVTLTVSGTNSGSVDTTDFPITYQGNPFTQLTGDSVGAQNFGTTSFQMEISFGVGVNTAGLVLAIGNLAHDAAFSGYQMTAFNAQNNPIPINAFGQLGSFDYTWTATNDMFNDNLSLANNGKFHVMHVAGQNDQNSDMLLLSLPAGVDRIFVNLQNSTDQAADTINFMVAPVPEPSSLSLVFLGGIAVVGIFRRKVRRFAR